MLLDKWGNLYVAGFVTTSNNGKDFVLLKYARCRSQYANLGCDLQRSRKRRRRRHRVGDRRCRHSLHLGLVLYYHQPTPSYDVGTLLYGLSSYKAEPGSYNLVKGTVTSGDVNALDNSDNTRLDIQKGIIAQSGDPGVLGTVSTSASDICFEVESHSDSTGISQEVEIYNYDSGQYERLDYRGAGTSDTLLHLSPFGDPDPYIDASGNVKVRLRYFITGITTLDDWKAKIDLGVWEYTT